MPQLLLLLLAVSLPALLQAAGGRHALILCGNSYIEDIPGGLDPGPAFQTVSYQPTELKTVLSREGTLRVIPRNALVCQALISGRKALKIDFVRS